MATTEQCFGCRFWLRDDVGSGTAGEAEPAWGSCRRNPPMVSDHMASMTIHRPRFGGRDIDPEDVATIPNVGDATIFPVTYFDKWCGEFAPQREA